MTLKGAKHLSLTLMRAHGLARWSFSFCNSYSFMGDCEDKLRRIRLSAPWTLRCSKRQVRDTVLHEIAHALVAPDMSHGEVWYTQARLIGCREDEDINPATPPEMKYILSCQLHGVQEQCMRLAKPYSCGDCAPVFDRKFLMQATLNPKFVEISEKVKRRLKDLHE